MQQFIQDILARTISISVGPVTIPSFTVGDAATYIGLAWLAVTLFRVVLGVLGTVYGSLTRKSLRSQGTWAVVTGGSEGIGLAYATELARQGLKIMLIARNVEKLDVATEHIMNKVPKSEVHVISADVGNAEALKNVHSVLEKKGVLSSLAVLVNNAGVSYPTSLLFDEAEAQKPGLFSSLINLNCSALTAMTALVVPHMKKNRKGIIINIGSAAGRVPVGMPYLSVYSATKAYVDFFSRSLALELAPFGIHVQCQAPYLVKTSLSGVSRSSLTCPDPATYARAAVADIGTGVSTVPYWPHKLQDAFTFAAPKWFLASQLVSMHKKIRARFFKKQAAAAKKD